MANGARFAALVLVLWAMAASDPLHAGEKPQDWQLVVALDYGGGGAMDIFLDGASIRRHGSVATVTEKIAHTHPKKSLDSPPASEFTDRIAVDCTNRRWANVGKAEVPSKLEWHERGKDWRRDALVRAVCKS
jgi:hypothetical protein